MEIDLNRLESILKLMEKYKLNKFKEDGLELEKIAFLPEPNLQSTQPTEEDLEDLLYYSSPFKPNGQ